MTIPENDEEAGGASKGASDATPEFDPLLGPWEEYSEPAAPSVFDDGDELAAPVAYRYAAAPSQRGTEDDVFFWEAPPAAPYAQPQPAWDPAPSHQAYTDRLTEVRSALQQEAVALPRPHRRWLVTVREVAETLLLAALIFLAVRASFQNFKVEGHSMDPSLADGEYLIVNKLTYAELDLGIFDFLPFFDAGDDPVRYLWGSPDRGDVIVFRAPTSPERDFIKRIIGLPGDTVVLSETTGEVKVNGALLTETYIQGTTNCSQSCTWTVPRRNTAAARETCGSNACYFVLGDNRQNSSDSRQGWLVPKENIVGKALITYWEHGEPQLDFAPNHSVGIVDQASAEQ